MLSSDFSAERGSSGNNIISGIVLSLVSVSSSSRCAIQILFLICSLSLMISYAHIHNFLLLLRLCQLLAEIRIWNSRSQGTPFFSSRVCSFPLISYAHFPSQSIVREKFKHEIKTKLKCMQSALVLDEILFNESYVKIPYLQSFKIELFF